MCTLARLVSCISSSHLLLLNAKNPVPTPTLTYISRPLSPASSLPPSVSFSCHRNYHRLHLFFLSLSPPSPGLIPSSSHSFLIFLVTFPSSHSIPNSRAYTLLSSSHFPLCCVVLSRRWPADLLWNFGWRRPSWNTGLGGGERDGATRLRRRWFYTS